MSAGERLNKMEKQKRIDLIEGVFLRAERDGFSSNRIALSRAIDYYMDIEAGWKLYHEEKVTYLFTIQFFDYAIACQNVALTLVNILTVDVLAFTAAEAVLKATQVIGDEGREQYRISKITELDVQKLLSGGSADHDR